MVIFDNLHINPDGKTLTIKAHVSTDSLYEGMFITDVYIVDSKTFAVNLDIENATKLITFDEEKEIEFTITATKAGVKDFKSDMYFVYVKTEGRMGILGSEAEYTVGVALYTKGLYDKGMQYIKELNDVENIPKHLIDFILHTEALKISIETGHYNTAKEIFNKLWKK